MRRAFGYFASILYGNTPEEEANAEPEAPSPELKSEENQTVPPENENCHLTLNTEASVKEVSLKEHQNIKTGDATEQEDNVEPQPSNIEDNSTVPPERTPGEVEEKISHMKSNSEPSPSDEEDSLKKNPRIKIVDATEQDENVKPQPSNSDPIQEDNTTVHSKRLPGEVEDKISHMKSNSEPSPSDEEVSLKENQTIDAVDQDVKAEPQQSPTELTSEDKPTVPSMSLSEETKNQSNHLESDKEDLSVCQGPLIKEQTLNSTAQEEAEQPKVPPFEVKTETAPAPPKRLADEIKAKSHHLKNSKEPLPVYQVPLEEEQINISGCRRFRFGKDDVGKNNRTIMVMGATGAGKSTLIDGMINYILDVHREDEYRFKLVKEVQRGTQAMSQTSEVTVYKLNYQDGFQINYSLTIIDTPGFGDTRGIKRDMEITEQIRNLFTSTSGQVLELDAVCFVVQAALARLTPSQRYVFDSVLSIFGKDIAENIRVLVTFADGKKPPVLEAITASGVPCPVEKGAPLHFKFNNSALFSKSNSQTSDEDDEEEDEEDFDEMFWKMGQKSMKRFFVALNKIPTKSLKLTKEVLTERKQLENLVENLQKQVRVGLSKLEEIRQTAAILETHKTEINRNAKFEFEVKVIEPRQIEKKANFITNCQQCSYTCHDDCGIANDTQKIHCIAMGSGGMCKVCPGKCIWSVHFNQKYTWEYVEVTKKETIKELKQKYDVATGEKNAAEVILTKLEDEYEAVQVEVTVMMDDTSACLNKLKDIALKPDPLSTPDYIDMLIEGEKAEAKPGWKQRVESLMGMKEKAEYMAKVGRKEVLLAKGTRVTLPKKSFLTKMMHRFDSAVVQMVERIVG